jgi:hypothetical protein
LAFSSGWSGPRYGGMMPELFPLYDKYHDQGLEIIEIRLDLPSGYLTQAPLDQRLAEVKKPFWKDHDIAAPIALVITTPSPVQRLTDAKRKSPCELWEDYGMQGIPSCVLIDRHGRVVGPFRPGRGNVIRDNHLLEKALREK